VISHQLRAAIDDLVAEGVGLADRVERGVAVLEDRFGPLWFEQIDLDSLDTSACEFCVVGQSCRDLYRDANPRSPYSRFLDHLDGQAWEYGFDVALAPDSVGFEELDQAWAMVVLTLRGRS
jgi:hypothetical protein